MQVVLPKTIPFIINIAISMLPKIYFLLIVFITL